MRTVPAVVPVVCFMSFVSGPNRQFGGALRENVLSATAEPSRVPPLFLRVSTVGVAPTLISRKHPTGTESPLPAPASADAARAAATSVPASDETTGVTAV